MMTSLPTNSRTVVRFGGPEDTSNRSAWKSTNRSLKPPSPADRKASIVFDRALGDAAALVAALDSEQVPSDSSSGGKNHKKNTPLQMPSALQHRSKSAPLQSALKVKEDPFLIPAKRSAWENSEIRNSFKSMQVPCPVQRQATLEAEDLKDACAHIRSLASSSCSSLTSSTVRDSSSKLSLRDCSLRDNSLKQSLRDNSKRANARW